MNPKEIKQFVNKSQRKPAPWNEGRALYKLKAHKVMESRALQDTDPLTLVMVLPSGTGYSSLQAAMQAGCQTPSSRASLPLFPCI